MVVMAVSADADIRFQFSANGPPSAAMGLWATEPDPRGPNDEIAAMARVRMLLDGTEPGDDLPALRFRQA